MKHLLHMGSVGDGNFSGTVRYGGGGDAAPRAYRLLPPPLQQVCNVIAVHLHVRAKQLGGLQATGCGDAAACLELCEGGGAGARCNACQCVHVVGARVGGVVWVDGAGGGG